jgi:hypothetical protein
MTAPTIACGDLRACLAGLLDQAQRREAAETDPERRERWARLVRYLTGRIAARVLRECGRPVPGKRGQHGTR